MRAVLQRALGNDCAKGLDNDREGEVLQLPQRCRNKLATQVLSPLLSRVPKQVKINLHGGAQRQLLRSSV